MKNGSNTNSSTTQFGEGGGGGGPTPPASRILYYYHPDYLGNVEYITDASGLPYQYFFYSPWGEALKDEKAATGTWASPYKFNGKEQDSETGLYYYGARYGIYPERHSRLGNPQVSVWLGVDPLAVDFSHLSPYNFVENNPINLVDPDGKSAICETCPENDEFEIFRQSEFHFSYQSQEGKIVRLSQEKIDLDKVKDPLLELNVFCSEVNRGNYKGDKMSDHFASKKTNTYGQYKKIINTDETYSGQIEVYIALKDQDYTIGGGKFGFTTKATKNKQGDFTFVNIDLMSSKKVNKASSTGPVQVPLLTIRFSNTTKGVEMLKEFASKL